MSLETLPRELRHLRACLGCSLVKTWEQFESDGCENCEPWMGMRGSRAAVLDCTSSSFEGLIGLACPSESWVARWQWLRGQAVGMYAISVAGRLPGHVLRQMKAKGKEYKSRDTATKQKRSLVPKFGGGSPGDAIDAGERGNLSPAGEGDMITNSAISPEITTALQPRKPLDANRYATKKTIAQGMLDIALLTANASQLKYILQVGDKHEFYSLMLGLITTSIILQVGLGVLFLSLNLLRDCRLHLIEYKTSALVINHIALAGTFFVTGLNLLISAFDPSLGRLAPANSELAQ